MLHGLRKTWGFVLFFLVEIREEKNNLFSENNIWSQLDQHPRSLTLPIFYLGFPTRLRHRPSCPCSSFLLIWRKMAFSLLVAWPVLQGSQSSKSTFIASENGPSEATGGEAVIAGDEEIGSSGSSSELLSLWFWRVWPLFIEFRQLLTITFSMGWNIYLPSPPELGRKKRHNLYCWLQHRPQYMVKGFFGWFVHFLEDLEFHHMSLSSSWYSVSDFLLTSFGWSVLLF